MAEGVLNVSKERDRLEVEKLEKDKEADLERIKLQIVADNDA